MYNHKLHSQNLAELWEMQAKGVIARCPGKSGWLPSHRDVLHLLPAAGDSGWERRRRCHYLGGRLLWDTWIWAPSKSKKCLRPHLLVKITHWLVWGIWSNFLVMGIGRKKVSTIPLLARLRFVFPCAKTMLRIVCFKLNQLIGYAWMIQKGSWEVAWEMSMSWHVLLHKVQRSVAGFRASWEVWGRDDT